jgi:hypothetical protein
VPQLWKTRLPSVADFETLPVPDQKRKCRAAYTRFLRALLDPGSSVKIRGPFVQHCTKDMELTFATFYS